MGACAGSGTVGRSGSLARPWPSGVLRTKLTSLTGACVVQENPYVMVNYVVTAKVPTPGQTVRRSAGASRR